VPFTRRAGVFFQHHFHFCRQLHHFSEFFHPAYILYFSIIRTFAFLGESAVLPARGSGLRDPECDALFRLRLCDHIIG
jgi:hypothetical protein